MSVNLDHIPVIQMPDASIHKALTIVNVCVDIQEMVYTHAQVYL